MRLPAPSQSHHQGTFQLLRFKASLCLSGVGFPLLKAYGQLFVAELLVHGNEEILNSGAAPGLVQLVPPLGG